MRSAEIERIIEEARKFGKIGENPIYPMKKANEFFVNHENGDYSLKN